MTAPPNLTLTITPPGGASANYAPFFAWSGATTSTTISSYFGRQGDTAAIVLVDDYSATVAGFPAAAGTPHFHIPPFSNIVLQDQGAVSQPAGGYIFTGLVLDPQFRWTAPGRVEWILNCVDYTVYADEAICSGNYAGLTADEIIVDLSAKSGSGLNAALVRNGGYVYPGPVIPIANFSADSLSNHWSDLVKLASQRDVYGWFVDYQRNLWFYPTSKSLPSGVTVTDIPSTATPSINECHIDPSQQMKYEWDGGTFYTRCVVEGATQTITFNATKAKRGSVNPTDAWVGNGEQASWALSYPPITSAATAKANSTSFFLTVGGIGQGVQVNDGSTAVTSPWQVVQASNGLWTLQVTPGIGSVPAVGERIRFWYSYQQLITAQADLVKQQRAIGGPNGGVFAEVINDSSLTTAAAAFARAQSELQEYGAPQERITFYTDESFLGWFRCGETFVLKSALIPNSVNGYALGMTSTFIAIQQMVSFKSGGYRTTQVTAVRLT